MKKLLFVIFTFTALTFLCCKQEQNSLKEPPLPKKVDSLFRTAYDNSLPIERRKDAINYIENYLIQRNNDSTKRNSYLRVANRYYNINDFDGEYKSALKAYGLALEAKDTPIIARSTMYIGDNFLSLNKIDSAFYYNYKATKYYPVTQDNNTQRSALSNLSLIYRLVKDYPKSEKYAVEALRVVEKDSNFLAQYGANNSLGKLFTETRKYDLAYKYHKKALKITELLNDTEKTYQLRLKSQSLLNIGVLKMEQESYNEADDFFQQTNAIDVLPYQNPSNYAYLLENWAYTKHMLGEKNILPLFKKALKIHDSLDSPSRSSAELLLAKYYKEIDKADSSFYFAQNAYASSKKNDQLGDELKALHLMAQTDKIENKSKWYEKYLFLQDSITKNERQQQEKFALIEYNTENIKREKQFAESQRDEANTRFWIALLLSILIIFLAIVIYVNRARKLKNKELLIAQKELEANEHIYNLMLEEQFKIEQGKHLEKKRISQELHDGVLGRLSGIRLNLFVLNKRKDEQTIEKCLPYIKSLQEVEKEIRAISHNLSEDLFSDQINFTKMVSGLFDNIKGHSNLKLNLYFDELIDWKTISTTTKIEVYRILQEGFHNIQKHAKASNVVVRMIQNETNIIIELIDDGIGISKTDSSSGIGLKNIRERAEKIHAELKIDSQPNKGTILSISIPKKN